MFARVRPVWGDGEGTMRAEVKGGGSEDSRVDLGFYSELKTSHVLLRFYHHRHKWRLA